jgi:hypothetical protein
MDIKNIPPAVSVTPQRCPFLGLHDDPGTSLAYPSAWNYCFRARPPASVQITHQVAACLSPGHVRCPVYRAVEVGALPSNLRGSSTVPTRSHSSTRMRLKRLAWSVLFIIAITLAVFFWQNFIPTQVESTATPSAAVIFTDTLLATATVRPGWTNPAQIMTIQVRTVTKVASKPPTLAGTVFPVTATRTPTRTRTPTATKTSTRTASPTLPVFTPIAGVCGHPLDIPFGGKVQFLLHQVVSGENLDMYARQHQTTTDAIRAVNYFLPLPVWENWIVVIPIGISDVSGVPLFEPYQADGTIVSLDELAKQLSADAQSLQKYNGFDDSCRMFLGWVLVPRESARP